MLLVEGLLLFCMIPIPPAYDIRGWGELTGINGPIWTLMFEYVANIFYALFLRRIGEIMLAVLVVLCGCLTADLCLNLNLWGNLTDSSFFYSMNGGCFFTPEHVFRGYVRLLFPFLMGMLLARCGRFIHIRVGFYVASALVLAVVAMPWLSCFGNLTEGIFQLLSIIVMAIAVAWAALKLYDEPVRQWLKEHWLK